MASDSKSLIRNLLNKADWKVLAKHQIQNLQYLQHVRIDRDFLIAASSFWDAKHHVFRFNGKEICPLYEEFSAILGRKPTLDDRIALPELKPEFPILAVKLFNLSPSQVDSFNTVSPAIPRCLNTYRLLNYLTGRRQGGPAWGRILIFCILAYFLLRTEHDAGDYAILSIIEQMEEGATPVPLILAETLHGLDMGNTKTYATGSPLLLQIWLQEKLSILVIPNVPPIKYEPKHHQRRALLPMGKTREEWKSFISTFPTTEIRWRCPWWRLDHITLMTYIRCIPLAGLHFASFYIPARLRRQYGFRQRVPRDYDTFVPGPLPQRFLDKLKASWPLRTIEYNTHLKDDVSAEDDYPGWVALQGQGSREAESGEEERPALPTTSNPPKKNKKRRF